MTTNGQDRAVDASEHRIQELQAELVPAQRLTDLGQVVATLVHEAHEPLTAIGNYANACRRLVIAGNRDDVLNILERIADQTNRAGEILHRICELVRPVDPTIEP
jgi:two-component system, LuxR family, sensor kinase FixL